MDLKLLKLSLKKELLWFIKAKKTLLLMCTMFIMPFIAEGKPTYPIINENNVYFFTILIGIIATVGQYFLDSIYQDVLRKINNFYFNLNIPLVYNLLAKMIVCLFLVVFYIFYCSIMMKTYLTFFEVLIVFLFFINLCIISYCFIIYLYNKDSMIFSCYITLFILMIFGAITFLIPSIFLQFLFQFLIMFIGFVGFIDLYTLKRIRLKIL